MSNLTKLFVHNRKAIERVPGVRTAMAQYLINRTRITIPDVSFQTGYGASHSLISAKSPAVFRRIMDHMDCYVGARFCGPNKYCVYPWALATLLSMAHEEIAGPRSLEGFPGKPGCAERVRIENGDIDVCNHADILQTSIGVALRKAAG